jgi:hypothetical protein
MKGAALISDSSEAEVCLCVIVSCYGPRIWPECIRSGETIKVRHFTSAGYWDAAHHYTQTRWERKHRKPKIERFGTERRLYANVGDNLPRC